MKEQLIQTIAAGIESEKKGIYRYLTMAPKVTTIKGKDIFIQMATDEYDHMRYLENLRGNLLGGETLSTEGIPMEKIEQIIQKRKEAYHLIKEKMCDLDVLEVALEEERRASDFYQKLFTEADDDQVKQLARFLQNWETSHVNFLKSQIEFLKCT